VTNRWVVEAERWMIRTGYLSSSGARTPEEKADLASLRNLLEAVWQDGKAHKPKRST
jgi:hypothetical protein